MKSKIALLFTLLSIHAFSQNYSPRIYIYPQYFLPSFSTDIRIDSDLNDLNLGTTLSLENELGFKKNQGIFRFHAIAGKSAQIMISYMNINRTGNAYLSRDIEFGDTVYHAGANTKSYFNSEIVGISWRFLLVNKPVASIGIALGAKWMHIETGIEVQSSDVYFSQTEKGDIPVPLIGLNFSSYVTPRLLARASFEYFHINIKNYKATAQDFSVSGEYYIFKNLGVGAAYSNSFYEIYKFPFNDDFSGKVNYSIKGLSVFLSARF